MLSFEPITLEKQEFYHKYFYKLPEQSADYTFINLFGLKDIYMLEWAFTDNLVWIRQKSPYTIYWAPVGDWFNCDIYEEIKLAKVECEYMIRIPKSLSLLLKNIPNFKIKETRDEWEYLYDLNELKTLPGKKFHKKKNLYNQFIKNDFLYKKIDNSIINHIFDFESKWEINESNVNEYSSQSNIENDIEAFDNNRLLSNEVRAEADRVTIKTLLDNFDKINNIVGGAIYIDNKVVAYTIADLSMRDTIVVHSEKGDKNYKGSYQAINRIFLENVENNDNRFKFVNREQDVGDLGLRKAKLSYNPVGFIEKYSGFC